MQTAKTVILTQEDDAAGELADALQAAGLKTIAYPCIETRYIPFDMGAKIGGKAIAEFSVYAFTSRRGAIGAVPARDVIVSGLANFACVGDATAQAVLHYLGAKCDVKPDAKFTGEGLAAAIAKTIPPPASVLHFRGDKTAGDFKVALENRGYEVGEIIVYENISPKLSKLDKGDFTAAAFASPSAAERFFEVNGDLKNELVCFAIGPTTAARLKEIGAAIVHESPAQTLASIASTIIEVLT